MALEVFLDRNMASGTMTAGLEPASGPGMSFFEAVSVSLCFDVLVRLVIVVC
jgi:hypothetical protein